MEYNLEAILKSIDVVASKKQQKDIAVHGGEPLCIPKEDVSKLLAKAKEASGHSSIQTNGTLIDREWINIFKENNTHVGVSLDGTGGLSRFRMSPEMEDKVMGNIRKMRDFGLGVSVISLLSMSNASTDEQLERYMKWLLELKSLGVGGRLNPCDDHENHAHELPIERMAEVYRKLTLFCLENGLTWSPMSDFASKLNGNHAVCSFSGCDMFCTDSAVVILGDGAVTNCMRTNIGDIVLRADEKTDMRAKTLQYIPQEEKGCKDCEYWNYCMGGCPVTGMDNDWRNRTRFCLVWKTIIKVLQNAKILTNYMLQPTSSNKCDKGNTPHTDKVEGHKDIYTDIPHKDVPHRNLGGAYGSKDNSKTQA
jgi:radical SAM protein with 4Fe4S-binding SPASM domain